MVAELTLIVPVAVAQVGCALTIAVGKSGVVNCALTTIPVTALIQPFAFLLVTV